LDQAATLPGGALFVGPLRRRGQPAPDRPDPAPPHTIDVDEVSITEVAPPLAELPLLQPVLDRAAPLVPGAVRRFFGRN
jgi:hypothetical protein